MERRHFSELTEEEILEMPERMENAAADYAKEIYMSGLSDIGCHNVYTATEQMLFKEWRKSKRVMMNWRTQNIEDRL